MSTDRRITADLVETLIDGRDGYEHAAKRLADTGRHDLVARFESFAGQRAELASELEALAAAYGDDIDEDGSLGASVHRTWLTLKASVTDADAAGVLDAALTGENHAVDEFERALEADLSPDLRSVVERQAEIVRSARDQVAALAEAADR